MIDTLLPNPRLDDFAPCPSPSVLVRSRASVYSTEAMRDGWKKEQSGQGFEGRLRVCIDLGRAQVDLSGY